MKLPRAALPPVDDMSKAIIELLQTDGRMPYAAIGKEVGLSEAAVRQRVQKLIEQGVLQISAITNPLQLGFTRQAMVGIKVEGDVQLAAQLVSQIAEVSYVVVTAGSFDIMAEVVCEDDDQLLKVANQQIRRIKGVSSTETFVYLQLTKQTYAWGTR